MTPIFTALAWQLLAILLMALLYFLAVAFHATAVLNVRAQLLMSAGRRLTPRVLGTAFIAMSLAIQVLAVASFVSPISRATPTGAVVLVIASGVALGRITWRSWRAIAPAYRELTWLKRYGVGAQEVMCFARRQVYSELVLEASVLTPFLGALVGTASAPNVGPEYAVPVLVASTGCGLFIVCRALDLHARHYAKLIFLRGVAQFWPEYQAVPKIRKWWWECSWLPSEGTLRARRSSSSTAQEIVRSTTHSLRTACLRLCDEIRPVNRQAYLAAMDPVVAAYGALEVVEGDIRKDRAVDRAIRLIATRDLTLLEPSRATVASITDDDAWNNTRPRRWIPAVAAVLSLATALWPLAKDIGQFVGH